MKKTFLTSQFDSPDKSPGFLLWQTYNKWQRLQTAALLQVGLTHMQFVLLAGVCWLEKQDNRVTQKRLAQHACIDPMMTSQVVRTLQKQGYITRVSNRNDQREMLLSTTQKGRDSIKKALIVVEQIDHTFFAALSDKNGFTQALITLIE